MRLLGSQHTSQSRHTFLELSDTANLRSPIFAWMVPIYISSLEGLWAGYAVPPVVHGGDHVWHKSL